jgi:hypothetical protein
MAVLGAKDWITSGRPVRSETPNARGQARQTAEASHERTLEAVSSTPLFGAGCVLDLTLPPALLCRALWYEATLRPLVLSGQALRLATREGD